MKLKRPETLDISSDFSLHSADRLDPLDKSTSNRTHEDDPQADQEKPIYYDEERTERLTRHCFAGEIPFSVGCYPLELELDESESSQLAISPSLENRPQPSRDTSTLALERNEEEKKKKGVIRGINLTLQKRQLYQKLTSEEATLDHMQYQLGNIWSLVSTLDAMELDNPKTTPNYMSECTDIPPLWSCPFVLLMLVSLATQYNAPWACLGHIAKDPDFMTYQTNVCAETNINTTTRLRKRINNVLERTKPLLSVEKYVSGYIEGRWLNRALEYIKGTSLLRKCG